MREPPSETRTLRVNVEDVQILLHALTTARAIVRNGNSPGDYPIQEIERLGSCLSDAFIESGPSGARDLAYMTYHYTHEEHLVDLDTDAIEAARNGLVAPKVNNYDAFVDLRRMLEQRWRSEYQRG